MAMVRKIAVSLVLGTLTFFVTEKIIADNGQLSAMTSVFVAGVIFMGQFLYEVQDQVDDLQVVQARELVEVDEKISTNLAEVDKRVKESVERLKTTELFQATVMSGILSEDESVQANMRRAIALGTDEPDLATRLARKELTRTVEFLSTLGRDGDVTYLGEDRDWILALAENTQHSIRATSLATVDVGLVDGGLWSTDLGLRYLQLQEEAIAKRGVTVQRIFIADVPNKRMDGAVMDIISQQRHIGVDVRVLDPSSARGVDAKGAHDFIIFDDELVYETTAAARPYAMKLSTRVTNKPVALQQLSNLFDNLWEQASPETGS